MLLYLQLCVIERHELQCTGTGRVAAAEIGGDEPSDAYLSGGISETNLEIAIRAHECDDDSRFAQNILKRHPNAKILGLSNAWSTEDSTALRNIGGRGYIVKTAPLDAIVNCIRKVYAGELCFEEDDYKA